MKKKEKRKDKSAGTDYLSQEQRDYLNRRKSIKDLSKQEAEYEKEKELEKKEIESKQFSSKVGSFLNKGFSSGVSPSVRTRDKVISSKLRKAINLVAPSGSMAKSITKGSGSSKGRGRPSGTYKTRVLPSGRVVKVPTAIYKKMLAAEKAQIRLANARQQAQLQVQADQIAMSQDPRFQPGAEDSFLGETDQIHEMNVADAQQQAQMPQYGAETYPQQVKKQGVVSRFVSGLNNIGSSAIRPRQTQYDTYGRPIQSQPQSGNLFYKGQVQEMSPRRPKVTAISDRANLLRVPNQFNNPGQTEILFKKGGRR